MANLISTTLSTQDLADIKAHLAGIQAKLPFLLGLSDEERKTMLKVQSANKGFITDVLKVGPNIIDDLPKRIDLQEIAKDNLLHDQLDEIRVIAEDLLGRIADTQVVAGNEAMGGALDVFNCNKVNVRQNVPGSQQADDEMGRRFARRSKPAVPEQKEVTKSGE
jgi:hypothetical protein